MKKFKKERLQLLETEKKSNLNFKQLNFKPISGVGLSARPQHFSHLLQKEGDLPWLEILIDNYLFPGSPQSQTLHTLSEMYPLTFHCVSLSIGSTDEWNWPHLKKIKALKKQFNPQWISDHLCWVSQDQKYLHDLIPLPYTDESVLHLCKRINELQDFFEQTLVIENVSHYLTYKSSSMSEVEFLCAILQETNCQLLLDINNLYVNSINHRFDAHSFLKKLPTNQIKQWHLAGHTKTDNCLIDTHSDRVVPAVWSLYQKSLQIFGDIPLCFEWDNDIPEYSVMLEEINQAKKLRQDAGFLK